MRPILVPATQPTDSDLAGFLPLDLPSGPSSAAAVSPPALGTLLLAAEPTVRKRLAHFLGRAVGVRRLGAYASLAACPETVSWGEVDLILLDVAACEREGGPREIRRLAPLARILVLASTMESEGVVEYLAQGAQGCVLWESSDRELAANLSEIRRGGSPLPPVLARRLVEWLQRLAAPKWSAHRLTAREREIVDRLGRGYQYKEVADQLSISLDTVRTHIRHLYSKLGVSNRRDAVLKCQTNTVPAGHSLAGRPNETPDARMVA